MAHTRTKYMSNVNSTCEPPHSPSPHQTTKTIFIFKCDRNIENEQRRIHLKEINEFPNFFELQISGDFFLTSHSTRRQ